MTYEVQFGPSTRKVLEKLAKPLQLRILAKIESLADEPRPDGCKKLQGSFDLWRVRVGEYRVVYEVRDAVLIILVVRVAHRREVYR